MYVCMLVCVCVCVSWLDLDSAYTHTPIHMIIQAYTLTLVHSYSPALIHSYTHTHIHAYTHIPPPLSLYLIHQKAPISGGWAAEICSTIQSKCFLHLESPITRVCGYDVPFPLIFEPLYVPDVNKNVDAIESCVRY